MGVKARREKEKELRRQTILEMAKDHRKFMPVPLKALVGNLLSLNITALKK